MSDECFDSVEERCRYMAQVAKVPAMKNTLTAAADTIEALRRERDELQDKCNNFASKYRTAIAESDALNLELQKRDKCSYMGPMRDCPTHGR